jgi:hypothetical protein
MSIPWRRRRATRRQAATAAHQWRPQCWTTESFTLRRVPLRWRKVLWSHAAMLTRVRRPRRRTATVPLAHRRTATVPLAHRWPSSFAFHRPLRLRMVWPSAASRAPVRVGDWRGEAVQVWPRRQLSTKGHLRPQPLPVDSPRHKVPTSSGQIASTFSCARWSTLLSQRQPSFEQRHPRLPLCHADLMRGAFGKLVDIAPLR